MISLKFKHQPILLFDDENSKKEEIKKGENTASETTIKFTLCKRLFPSPPNNQIIIDALKKGWEGIEALIKSSSNYPNGEYETILRLWGTHNLLDEVKSVVTPAFVFYLKNTNNEYQFKKGVFSITQDTIDGIKKRCIHYTKNEKQNKTLEACKKFSEAFNYAFDNKLLFYIDEKPTDFYSNTKHSVIRQTSKFLTIKDDKVIPDYKEILYNIKE